MSPIIDFYQNQIPLNGSDVLVQNIDQVYLSKTAVILKVTGWEKWSVSITSTVKVSFKYKMDGK